MEKKEKRKKEKTKLMIVIELLMLVRHGRGELCYSPPFVTRLLFVKGAWSCEVKSTGQLAALKTFSDERMTNLGRQKMGPGSVMWVLMWPSRRCPYLPYIWITLCSFLSVFLGSFQSSMGWQGWAMFSPDQISCWCLERKSEKVTDKQCLEVEEELVTDDQAKPFAW